MEEILAPASAFSQRCYSSRGTHTALFPYYRLWLFEAVTRSHTKEMWSSWLFYTAARSSVLLCSKERTPPLPPSPPLFWQIFSVKSSFVFVRSNAICLRLGSLKSKNHICAQLFCCVPLSVCSSVHTLRASADRSQDSVRIWCWRFDYEANPILLCVFGLRRLQTFVHLCIHSYLRT